MSKWVIALVVIQIICLIGVVVFVCVDYKKRHPPICDGCKWLIRKGGFRLFRYHCEWGQFDHAPKYCRRYKPKEGADHA